MRQRARYRSLVVRVGLALVLGLGVAACSTTSDTGDGSAGLAPQASGSFSGGSLSRGSVIGLFQGVGIGNEVHTIEMVVEGAQIFECRNNGGNLAPGQFAYTAAVTQDIPLSRIDDNGRFTTSVTAEDEEPLDSDCKKNWTVNTDADGTKVTFIQVATVTASLFDSEGGLRDTLSWTCEDPFPTSPISAYDAPPLTGEGGVCALVDGPR